MNLTFRNHKSVFENNDIKFPFLSVIEIVQLESEFIIAFNFLF